ncbi:MAG TPA: FKBP-type peptidyl-prolyl cis-trans isomerase [Lacibacter sp.]|nr:FKBP-type peptidyl-prolyl cis-trans isomerase [Lacibacter sp.]
MKKTFAIAAVIILSFTACKKKEEPCTATAGSTVVSASEEALVTTYLSNNNITNAVELENSGMYYSIESSGGAQKPEQCDNVTVKYIGRRQDGTVFDQTSGNNTASFILANLIEGWRRGIPLIGAGGKLKLYIPPSMHYGPAGLSDPVTRQVIIPPNQIIIFDMELVTFQ